MLVRHIPLVLAAALLLSGCGLLQPEVQEPVVAVQAPVTTQREVTAIKQGTIEARQSLNISIGSARQSSLYFRTQGRVRQLKAAPGQHVAAGAVLAQQEPGSIPMDLAQAQITLEKAQVTLDTAKRQVGFVNGPTPDQIQRDELDVRSAQLQVQRQQELLANIELTAPYAGTVVSVAVNEGDNVNAYAEVLVLAADGLISARATVTDVAAATLQPGMAAEIFPADGDPTPVKGHVVSVQPVGGTGSNRAVVIQPEAPAERLKVGRNGKAEVITQSKQNVLLVPLSAIRTFGGRSFVTVVKGSTRQEVAITTGIQSDTYAEVLSGLQAGDQVVGR